MAWDTGYDRFLSISAWANAILYSAPAIILVFAFEHYDSTKQYVIPALLVYLIAAIAHMVGQGFQAVCIQIKVSTDYAVEQCSGRTSE